VQPEVSLSHTHTHAHTLTHSHVFLCKCGHLVRISSGRFANKRGGQKKEQVIINIGYNTTPTLEGYLSNLFLRMPEKRSGPFLHLTHLHEDDIILFSASFPCFLWLLDASHPSDSGFQYVNHYAYRHSFTHRMLEQMERSCTERIAQGTERRNRIFYLYVPQRDQTQVPDR
jgi:hypothetical protein